MNKLSLLGSAIALACLTGSAIAAQLDDATRQQIYNDAYQNLAQEQHTCQGKDCGAAIPSDKVESIFNTAYVNGSGGQQPSYEDFLHWKYLSNYPTSISSDKHFSQASEVKINKKSAAVREMPSSSMTKEKKTETQEKKTESTKKHCDEK